MSIMWQLRNNDFINSNRLLVFGPRRYKELYIKILKTKNTTKTGKWKMFKLGRGEKHAKERQRLSKAEMVTDQEYLWVFG